MFNLRRRPSNSPMAFVYALAEKTLKDRLPTFAASLAYTTILSLAPLAAISLSVFSSFKGAKPVVMSFVFKWLLPNEELAKIIGKNMDVFSANAASVSIFGVIALALIGVWVMTMVEKAFNMIWRAPENRPFFRRFVIYWTAITFSPVLIGASVAITASLRSMMASGSIYAVSYTYSMALSVAPYLFTWAAFALAYRLIPNTHVKMGPAWTGALVAGVMFEAAKRGFDYYLRSFAGYDKIYGALSVIPAFLLWLYVVWLIALFGAALAYVIQHRVWLAVKPDENIYAPYRAMELLTQAVRDYLNGMAPMTPERAEESIGLHPDVYETVTRTLHELDVIEFTGEDNERFLLKKPPELVKAGPLLMSLAGSGLAVPQPREDGADETLRRFFENTKNAAFSGADDVTLLTLAKRNGKTA